MYFYSIISSNVKRWAFDFYVGLTQFIHWKCVFHQGLLIPLVMSISRYLTVAFVSGTEFFLTNLIVTVEKGY